ncbi:MAG: glycoside hydrolase family 5 protein, partial [Actinomycetota bacterium]|nr:glycoside hydrolase family 5 protein [Actinomycetota bacterium]
MAVAVAGSLVAGRSIPPIDFAMRAATTSAGPPALSVSGNQLMAGGQRVQLHGANMSGTEFVCAQNWTSDPFGGAPEDDPQTFAAMRSWGINAVRVPLNEDCWLGINGVQIGGAAYQGAVVKLVRDLEAAGMYVIVDLHWSAPGSQRALSQNPAPDSDHSVTFWQQVASTFSSDGAVIFDLYNEPYFYWIADGTSAFDCLWNGCTLGQYVTGGSPYTVSQRWRSAGFSQLISTIRSTGAPNVIMAAGADWANDLSGWLSHVSADPNVIASWHSYPGQGCSPQSCWNSVIAPIAQRRPIVVGETGDNSSPPLQYMPTFLPWADQQGISYLPWTWNAWGDAANVLVSDMRSGVPTGG